MENPQLIHHIAEMEHLKKQYRELVQSAEQCRRDNNGEASVKEAEYYSQAAELCMTLAQKDPSARDTWLRQSKECEHKISQIVDILAPPKPVNKNIPDDIPAEIIEKWYRKKPSVTWDDIVGREALKAQLRREIAAILRPGTEASESARSYFFYGLPGTGKTLAARAFVRELMDAGFQCLCLSASDIHSCFVGESEKKIRAAFQEAMDHAPCVLFFDNIECICRDRSRPNLQFHERSLTNAVLESLGKLLHSGKPVILLTESAYPQDVDGAFIGHSCSFRFDLPDTADRAAYFAKTLGHVPIEDSFSFRDMADATENYGYRQLRRLSDDVLVHLKSALFEKYAVFTADGTMDQKASEEAAFQALTDGRFPLTRAIFEAAQAEWPLRDKTPMFERLRAFEERSGL